MKTPLHMLATLLVIGSISGAALSQVFEWATPQIEANRKAETEAAIKEVFPKVVSTEPLESETLEAYQAFDEAGELLGYAVVYAGNGFQGEIRLIFGTTPDTETITGFRALEHQETPGIGTILNDPWYYEQYDGLSAKPQVGWVKEGEDAAPNEIHAKTGATISSKSVVAIINAGLEELRATVGDKNA